MLGPSSDGPDNDDPGSSDMDQHSNLKDLQKRHFDIIKLQFLAVIAAVLVPLLSIIILEMITWLNLPQKVITLPIEIAGKRVAISGTTFGQAIAFVLIIERLLRLMLFGYPTVNSEYQPFRWLHDK